MTKQEKSNRKGGEGGDRQKNDEKTKLCDAVH